MPSKEALIEAIEARAEALAASGALDERREASRCAWILGLLRRRCGTWGIERLGGADAVRERIDAESSTAAIHAQLLAELGVELA